MLVPLTFNCIIFFKQRKSTDSTMWVSKWWQNLSFNLGDNLPVTSAKRFPVIADQTTVRRNFCTISISKTVLVKQYSWDFWSNCFLEVKASHTFFPQTLYKSAEGEELDSGRERYWELGKKAKQRTWKWIRKGNLSPRGHVSQTSRSHFLLTAGIQAPGLLRVIDFT